MIVARIPSQLITLARINRLDLLRRLYVSIVIPAQVHAEVAIAGAGLPGSGQVSQAVWFDVRHLSDPTALSAAQSRFGLAPGELGAILLAEELRADLVLLDELAARQLARTKGLRVRGCVGVLEAAFRTGELPDLRQAYADLLRQRVYIDRDILNTSLGTFHLPPL